MGNERYKIISHDTELQYISNCPIILQAIAITKDKEKNQILAQCKFKNLGNRQITAMHISMKCYAIDSIHLEDVEHFAYMDLKVRQYEEFGDRVPIYLPDIEIRKIVLILKKIVFDDGTIWENKEDTPYTKLIFSESPISSLKPLDEQYIRELQKISDKWSQHSNLPACSDIFVRCGCGKILVNESDKVCPNCKINLNELLGIQDKEYLANKLEQYNEEEEKIRKSEEEYKRIKEVRRKEKSKRLKKIITVGVAFIAVGITAIFGVTTTLFGEEYQSACQAFADGDYSSAEELFSDIGSIYKDVGAWQTFFEYMDENGYDIEDKTEVIRMDDSEEMNDTNIWNNIAITNFDCVLVQHIYIAEFAVAHPDEAKRLLDNDAFAALGKDSLQRVADFLYSYTKYAYDWYKVLGNNDIDPAPLLESINIAYELYSLADSDENRQQNCEYIIAQLQEMA